MINQTNKIYFRILVILLIVLLFLDIYLLNSNIKLKKDNLLINDYLRYFIVLKLDRQSDIFYKLGTYAEEIDNNSMDINEIRLYISGIKEFLQNDISKGINEIVFKDNKPLKDTLSRATAIIIAIGDSINRIFTDNFNTLTNNLRNLSYLLDRKNKENSLTYYIFKNDLNNPQTREVLDKINQNLSSLEKLLNVEY